MTQNVSEEMGFGRCADKAGPTFIDYAVKCWLSGLIGINKAEFVPEWPVVRIETPPHGKKGSARLSQLVVLTWFRKVHAACSEFPDVSSEKSVAQETCSIANKVYVCAPNAVLPPQPMRPLNSASSLSETAFSGVKCIQDRHSLRFCIVLQNACVVVCLLSE